MQLSKKPGAMAGATLGAMAGARMGARPEARSAAEGTSRIGGRGRVPSANLRAGAWATALLALKWWEFAARWERRAASAATRSSSSRRGWRKRPATARVIIIQGK